MEKKKNDDSIIEELLPRYCEGNVSEEEYHIISEWIASSDENSRIANQINSLFLASDTVRVTKKLNTEKALSDITGRINKKKRLPRWQYVQRIAAILFIPLVLAHGLRYFQPEKAIQVEMIQTSTNPGMTTRLVLPDESIAFLNSETTLEYPSSFDQDTRQVLLNGEAFFDVKTITNQPFVVSTFSDAKIEVVGTKFNVEAYRNKKSVSVTLVEGQINFFFRENAQNKKLLMQAGHKVVYDLALADTKLYKSSGRSETAWVAGKIIFEKTPFDKALQMLEKRYHVEFIIKNPRFKDDSFSGEFTSQRLDRILEYFKLSSNIRWRYLETDHEKEERTKIEIY